MGATALVTGASGYIASHLVPTLVGEGWDVRAVGRRPRPDSLPQEVDYRRVDLAAPESAADVAALVDGVGHVFHLAGASSSRSDEAQMHRDNVVATDHLLAAATRAGVEVALHVSSTSVYGEERQLPSPVPETVEPSPSRGYGKAKWLTEQVVQRHAEAGLGTVVLRPVSVHGPGATKLLASALLDAAVEHRMGLPALAVHRAPIEQRLVHVDDVVAACVHLAGRPEARGRAFNLAMDTYPTSVDVAGMLADEFGLGLEPADDPDCGPSTDERAAVLAAMRADGMTDDILFTPERFRFMRKANRNNRVDLSAILGTGFHFTQTDLRAAIAELRAWCEQHRWIV